MKRLLDAISSIKLTLVCLGAAMVVVFVGTLAQVQLGIHAAQEQFFQSLIVWWQPVAGGISLPVLPGGHLIGGVLLVNLITAHVRRFRRGWRKSGIHLIHAGLAVMLAGGLLTDLLSIESFMRLDEGETRNYSEHPRRTELAIIDEGEGEDETVVAIPEGVLGRSRELRHPSLPFSIGVREFHQNSRLHMATPESGLVAAASTGTGAQVAVQGIAPASRMNERNLVSAVLEFRREPEAGEPIGGGTWLVSNGLAAPQRFTFAGRTWRIELRPQRFYRPFSITLHEFTHERYPGTDIPSKFASRVTLADPERAENRGILISMNDPLRYRGETFYQSGFDNNDTTSILQVVRNPGYTLPYISCVMVAAGMLIQFGIGLAKFSRRRSDKGAAPATASKPQPVPVLVE